MNRFVPRGVLAFLVFAQTLHFFQRDVGARSDITGGAGPRRGSAEKESGPDRVREGISEGCRSAEPERVAPGGGNRLSSDIPPRSPHR